MAFSDTERLDIERMIDSFLDKRRPPVEIRNEVDLGCRIDRYCVEVFELRPMWRNPEETIESPVAKATYVRKTGLWKVFWMRGDLKWHRYDPSPAVGSLDRFFMIVDADENHCFFG
jgi:Protein of unknown function (DUF3024)